MTTHTASTTISSPNGWPRYIKSPEELTHWFIAPQDNDLSPVLYYKSTGHDDCVMFSFHYIVTFIKSGILGETDDFCSSKDL